MSFLNYLRSGSNNSPKSSQGTNATADASSGELAPGPCSPRTVSGGDASAKTVAEALPLPAKALETVNEEENLVRLAHDLQQEVQARTADVAALRTEASSQHALLSRLAEQVLAGASPAEGGAKREELVVIQQQMELQAGALREGLMDIQQQRAEMQQQRSALVTLAERIDQLSTGGEAGAVVGAGSGAISELRREVAEVREAVGSFRTLFAGQVEDLRREVRRGRISSGGADEVLPTREECAAMGRGISDSSEATSTVGFRTLQLRKELSEELAEELAHMEHRFAEFSQALDAERSQRQAGAEELRQRLQSSAEQLEQRGVESTLRQLRQELGEERAKLGQDLAAAGVQRAEQFERKLLAMHSRLEETAVSRSEFVQLSEEVRDVRGEAASRLAEGSGADSSCMRGQLEGLAASLSELDVRQGAAEARLAAELGRLAAAVDIAQSGSRGASIATVAGGNPGEDTDATFSDAQRFAAELEEMRARSASMERSLRLEIERVASSVNSSPWSLAQDEVARSLADVAGLRGEFARLHQQLEAVEAREMTLRKEISVCLQLGQDAAARLPALTAQVERMEANAPAVASAESGGARLPAPGVLQPVPQAKQPPLLQQPKRLPAPTVLGSAVVPADALGATVPTRQVLVVSTSSSVTFPAKAGPLTISPSVQLPLTQAAATGGTALLPMPQLKSGIATRQEIAGLLQSANTPRGSPHSVPAAMHGLTEAARALQPGASRRKALVVACSYFSSQVPLRGALNDAWNMQCLLRHTLQYAEDQVRLLIDGSEFCRVGAAQGPTKANVLEGLEWLTADAQPGDDLFFYFSGYGTQQPSGLQGDLCEGHLVPSDFGEGPSCAGADAGGAAAGGPGDAEAGAAAASGHRLVPLADISRALAKVPAACKVTMVLDCCFSLVPGIGPTGTAQPATFSRVTMKPPPPVKAGDDSPLFAPRSRYLDLPLQPGQRVGAADSARGGAPEPSCLVHCYSACQHPQWCVEIPIEGVVQGAFTWAWVKALLSVHFDAQVAQLCSALKGIMAELKDHFQWLDQTPVVQLSASAKLREGQREEAAPYKSLKMPVVPLPANHRRRKALLVGINYSDSNLAPAQLKGCVNDAWNVHSILRRTLQFSDDQIRVLVDGEHGVTPQAARAPTRANIVAGLQWLVNGAQPGDCLLFLFCGYGAQHPRSVGGAEHEAYLVPSDFAADMPEGFSASLQQDHSAHTSPTPSLAPSPVTTASGQGGGGASKGYRLVSLLEVNRLLAQLPARSCLTMVLDCSYPAALGLSPAQSPGFPRVVRGRVDYRKVRDYVTRPRFLELPVAPVQHTPEHARTPVAPECVVHCFAACRLEEWSCELPLEGTVQGTFTWAFTKALAAGHYKCSVSKLHEAVLRITNDLKQHFKGVAQTPVLSLSRSASGENAVLCL